MPKSNKRAAIKRQERKSAKVRRIIEQGIAPPKILDPDDGGEPYIAFAHPSLEADLRQLHDEEER